MIAFSATPLAGAMTILLAGGVPHAPATVSNQAYEFRFDPPTRMALATIVTESHDLLLVELKTRRGEDSARDTETALRLRSRADVLFADERDGPDGRVRRRYVDVAGSIQLVDPASVNEETGEWEGSELKLTSPLAGVSVAFQPARSQPDGYGRHFDAKALREPILPRLSAPVDWSSLLPPMGEEGASTAALGDSWPVAPELLEPLLAPTGFLGWRGDESADQQIVRAHASGVGGNLHLGFDGNVTGQATARIVAISGDPEFGPVAEIQYTYEIVVQVDRTDFVADQRLEREGEDGIEMLGAELKVHLEGTATLQWGIDAGRPIVAFVTADEDITMKVRVLPPTGDVAEQSMRMTGSLVNGLKFRELSLAPVVRHEGR